MNLLEKYVSDGIIELDFLLNQFLEICYQKKISFQDSIDELLEEEYPYIWCNYNKGKWDFCCEYETEAIGIFRTFKPTAQILGKNGDISLRAYGDSYNKPVYKYLKFDPENLGEPTDRYEIELGDNNIDLYRIMEPMSATMMRYSSLGQLGKNGVNSFNFEPLHLVVDDERSKALNEIANLLNKNLATMSYVLSKYEFDISEADLKEYEDCFVFTLKSK